MQHKSQDTWYGTTIMCLKKGNEVVMAGDGQVTLGHVVMKSTANKLRTLGDGNIIGGFAGATADAFTLFERLEEKLEKHPNQLIRAAVELAKDWRTDKYLRRLEAMLIVANSDSIYVISGSGDVLEPEGGIAAIGSGGNYALAAARALIDVEGYTAEDVARKSMKIAADLCIYSNHELRIEKIPTSV